MKKNLFSILLVVVMTLAMVACGTQETTNDVPVSTETIEATVENSEVVESDEVTSEVETSTEVVEPESSEATSEPEQATEAPVDEVASTLDSEAVESEASEPETNEPEFTVTELNATKYAIQSVNVRSGPSTDYDKIGGLTTNQEVQVTGQASTGWYRFTWIDGSEVYVSDKYLSDSKVEVQKPADNSDGGNSGSGQTNSSAKNWQDYYQDHVWYDMNDFMFIIVDSRAEGQNTTDYEGAKAILAERFPGEEIYPRAGGELRDGHWMFFVYVPSGMNTKTAFINQFK